ncbi:MAG TPA: glycoside hydrolase N-terminal domain-containing protein [Sedimentisphaerales bacterium]|nr:glycoside hydrolase N-terminal domain-containing protein [Sedimentisphaerales bacterium]
MNQPWFPQQIIQRTVTVAMILLLLRLPTVAADDVLWLAEPAGNWEKEAFPLGNGRLGCMVFGGIEEEHLQFNVDSLWTGDENLEGDYRAPGRTCRLYTRVPVAVLNRGQRMEVEGLEEGVIAFPTEEDQSYVVVSE